MGRRDGIYEDKTGFGSLSNHVDDGNENVKIFHM